MSLSCLGYADDVLLFSGSKASLEAMIEDCCVNFGEAGLVVGLDKNPLEQFDRNGRRNSASAWPEYCVVTEAGVYWVRDRAWSPQWRSGETSNAKGVLTLLQVETSPVQPEPVVEGESAFGASTLSSATWLSGCWTLLKQQEQASESWCARLLSQMVGFKPNPHDDFFFFFWRKLTRRGHELAETFAVSLVDMYLRAKHRLAGHSARFESDNLLYQMLVCRKLAWWRQEQRVWNKSKFGGAHPQRFNAWR